MSKTRDELLLSRRGVIRALGAAAVAGLPGCGGGGQQAVLPVGRPRAL